MHSNPENHLLKMINYVDQWCRLRQTEVNVIRYNLVYYTNHRVSWHKSNFAGLAFVHLVSLSLRRRRPEISFVQ